MSSAHTNRQWMVIFIAFLLLAATSVFAMLYEVKTVREGIQADLKAQPQALLLRAEVGIHHVRLQPQDEEATCVLTMGAVVKGVQATYDDAGNLTGGYFTRQSGLGSCEGTFWLNVNQLTGQLTTPFKPVAA